MKNSLFNKQTLSLLPISTRRGIQKLEYDFLKMRYSTFSDEQFVDQIEESLKTFSEMLDEAVCAEDDSSLLVNQLKSIEDCIEFISHAITNRLQSGRFLYEANLFKPHNMGSFSELYSFYESFVDLLQKLIIAYNQKRDDLGTISRLSFLVDISTHSSISAQLFIPSTCEPVPLNRLIGITINETAFFQIKNTIIFLLHEIGHYVRPYKRRDRNKVVLDILTDWLAHLTAHEMSLYLQSELPLFAGETADKNDKISVQAIKNHFEDAVFTALVPLLSDSLEDYFDRFAISDEIKHTYGDRDPSLSTLHVFHDILNQFLVNLSRHLSETLLWPKAVANKPLLKQVVLHKLAVEMPHNILKASEAENTSYFAYFCQSATRLFDEGGIFEYKNARGNSRHNTVIESYLKSLSMLGLNEYSTNNLDLFVSVLMKCLKKSIEATIEKSMLDMFIRGIDEALANLFWIRMLDIKDFESYWKIENSLIGQSVFSDIARIRFFGIPNAIITEYFELLRNNTPREKQHYKIPAIDYSLFEEAQIEHSQAHVQSILDDLRFIFFVPVAQFLLNETSVFPEEHLFQLKKNSSISGDGKQVLRLREAFRTYLSKSAKASRFEDEIQLIHFFTRDMHSKMMQ